jgi:hypothetical protein
MQAQTYIKGDHHGMAQVSCYDTAILLLLRLSVGSILSLVHGCMLFILETVTHGIQAKGLHMNRTTFFYPTSTRVEAVV